MFAQSWLVFTSAVPVAVVAGVVKSPTLLVPRMLSSPLAGTRTCSQDQALLSMHAPVNRMPCQTFSSVKTYIIILNYTEIGSQDTHVASIARVLGL